jgi:Domain of unknown function (DUF4397)
MKNCIRLILAFALLCPALNTAMFAADNAYLYLLQGIPGRDFSAATDPVFPVDIQINGDNVDICYEHGLTYGDIAGPLTLAPGSYELEISVADSLAPCSNTPFLEKTIALGAGKNVSAVVALNQAKAPTLLTFTNNFAAVTAGDVRVLLAQAVDAPTLTVVLQNKTTLTTTTHAVKSGALLDVTLPAAEYSVTVNQGTTTLVSSSLFSLDSQSVLLLYAVGGASNSTVTLPSRIVRNVVP